MIAVVVVSFAAMIPKLSTAFGSTEVEPPDCSRTDNSFCDASWEWTQQQIREGTYQNPKVAERDDARDYLLLVALVGGTALVVLTVAMLVLKPRSAVEGISDAVPPRPSIDGPRPSYERTRDGSYSTLEWDTAEVRAVRQALDDRGINYHVETVASSSTSRLARSSRR
jgi:hypothetical protein